MLVNFFLSPDDEHRYLCLGEVAEMQSAQHVGQDTDVMHILVSDLFAGQFDPPPTRLVPHTVGPLRNRLRQTMAFPVITEPVKGHGNALIEPPRFLGWRFGRREDVLLTLNRRNHLPFTLQGVTSEEDLALAYDVLCEHPFLRYPVAAQAYFDNVLVAKTVLQKWFAVRGFEPPWQAAVDPGFSSKSRMQIVTEIDSLSPGRPRKRAWDRIKCLVRGLHAENPDQLFKCIAHQVLDIVVAEFPPEEIPSFSTLQKSIGNIIRS